MINYYSFTYTKWNCKVFIFMIYSFVVFLFFSFHSRIIHVWCKYTTIKPLDGGILWIVPNWYWLKAFLYHSIAWPVQALVMIDRTIRRCSVYNHTKRSLYLWVLTTDNGNTCCNSTCCFPSRSGEEKRSGLWEVM